MAARVHVHALYPFTDFVTADGVTARGRDTAAGAAVVAYLVQSVCVQLLL